jgi:inorganic triphosphatase YgiF
MGSEVEIKLRLPRGAARRLEATPLLRGVRARVTQLEAIYFDTPDRLLQRHELALRLRRSGRTWVQTLKAADTARGGLSTRREWEAPARMRGGKPRIDWARLHDTPLPGLLSKHRRRTLQEVFRVKVRRATREIEFGRSRIEVALDTGTLHAGGRRDTVAEVELELNAGASGDLVDAAIRLVGRGASALGLVPLLAGKAERGYRLADGTPPPLAKASAPGFVAELDGEMSSGAALRAIVGHGLQVLLANTDAMRVASDSEYLHQARVAIRRMRSAARLLDREEKDLPPTLARDLRWIGRLLGAARDGDVLLEETLPRLIDHASEPARASLQPLLERARVRRDLARERALAALASGRFASVALRLLRWSTSDAPAGRALERRACKALDRAHRRLFKAAQFFAALSPAARHRVRILAKRLRYALDVFSVTLPEAATTEYVNALAELQDVLGALNDEVVAHQALARLGSPAARSGLLERLRAAEAPRLLDAEARLLQLSARVLPWRAESSKPATGSPESATKSP